MCLKGNKGQLPTAWETSVLTTECEESELSFNLYVQKLYYKHLLLHFFTNRTITIELTKISFQKNFYTIPMLMVNVLHLHSCKNYGERQTNLQNKVNGLLDKKFYCILNDIFYVQVTGGVRPWEETAAGQVHSDLAPLNFATPLLIWRIWVVRKWLPSLPEQASTFLRHNGSVWKRILKINSKWPPFRHLSS